MQYIVIFFISIKYVRRENSTTYHRIAGFSELKNILHEIEKSYNFLIIHIVNIFLRLKNISVLSQY